jgi:hypothetical protein
MTAGTRQDPWMLTTPPATSYTTLSAKRLPHSSNPRALSDARNCPVGLSA